MTRYWHIPSLRNGKYWRDMGFWNKLSDIFYRDPNLFQTQCRVDSMIVRICMTLACSRASLNISASPRSVVLGPVHFLVNDRMTRSHRTSVREKSLEQLIPDPSMLRGVCTHANWVLVVEKHAIFQTLCSQHFLERVQNHGIICPGLIMTVRQICTDHFRVKVIRIMRLGGFWLSSSRPACTFAISLLLTTTNCNRCKLFFLVDAGSLDQCVDTYQS